MVSELHKRPDSPVEDTIQAVFTKLSQPVAMAPMFLPRVDGASLSAQPSRDIRISLQDKTLLILTIPNALLVEDETLCLVVLSLLGQESKGFAVGLKPETEVGARMRTLAGERAASVELGGVEIRESTLFRLLYRGDSAHVARCRQRLRMSIFRISKVSYFYDGPEGGQGNTLALMNAAWSGEEDPLYTFVVMPLLAAAAQVPGHSFAALVLDDRWRLSGDIAKIIYRLLCAMTWQDGRSRTILVDDLVRMAWDMQVRRSGDVRAPTLAQSERDELLLRSRRGRVRKALEAIGELDGWKVRLCGCGSRLTAEVVRDEHQRLPAGTRKAA